MTNRSRHADSTTPVPPGDETAILQQCTSRQQYLVICIIFLHYFYAAGGCLRSVDIKSTVQLYWAVTAVLYSYELFCKSESKKRLSIKIQ